jgi:hypothetical protein
MLVDKVSVEDCVGCGKRDADFEIGVWASERLLTETLATIVATVSRNFGNLIFRPFTLPLRRWSGRPILMTRIRSRLTSEVPQNPVHRYTSTPHSARFY